MKDGKATRKTLKREHPAVNNMKFLHIFIILCVILALLIRIWTNFQRITELFSQNFVIKLSKDKGLGSGIRDPGSEIWDTEKPIPDPGSAVKKSRIPDPQHMILHMLTNANQTLKN
jgi:hypothetical protein